MIYDMFYYYYYKILIINVGSTRNILPELPKFSGKPESYPSFKPEISGISGTYPNSRESTQPYPKPCFFRVETSALFL